MPGKLLSFFDYFKGGESLSLEGLINQTRYLVAYDKKLKNAVTKSMVKILDDYGMVLTFKYSKRDNRTYFEVDKISPKSILHLGDEAVTEILVSRNFVTWLKS